MWMEMGRNRRWPNRGTLPASVTDYWAEQRKFLTVRANTVVENRSESLPVTNVERYR
jgi:hypothetical protein